MTKRVKISQGAFALVDDEDYPVISRYKWHLKKSGDGRYAETTLSFKTPKQTHVSMHRMILGCSNKKHTDHINGNGLDNRKKNLRYCTHAENRRNSRGRLNGNSKYKGVYRRSDRKIWHAVISITYKNKRKVIYLGSFKKETDAALAYNRAAKKYWGRFAWMNKVRNA